MTLGHRQAAALTLGPFAWAASFQINYLLATSYCGANATFWLHVVIIAVLLAALASLYHGWTVYSQGPESGRPVFLGAIGAMLNILIICIALAQWVPVFWFAPCQH